MTTVARRTFLTSLGVGIAAPAILRAQGQKQRLPLCFSTYGCPGWSWKAILDAADRLGYAAIEVRFLEYDPNLPRRPEFTGDGLKETRQDLAALGLRIADLGSAVRLHEKDPKTRRENFDDGRRFIDLAHSLGAPYIRVFPDKLPPAEPLDDVIARIIEGGRELAGYARDSGVSLLLESHGDVTRSDQLERILRGVDSDRFALLWDAHHTHVLGKEPPAETYARLSGWVRHTHLKDSRPQGSGRRHVLVGDGDVPVKQQVDVLVKGGYKGYYSFEWELCGFPDIGEPEVAFPHYAKIMGEYLAAAGVKAS